MPNQFCQPLSCHQGKLQLPVSSKEDQEAGAGARLLQKTLSQLGGQEELVNPISQKLPGLETPVSNKVLPRYGADSGSQIPEPGHLFTPGSVPRVGKRRTEKEKWSPREISWNLRHFINYIRMWGS